MELIPCGRRGRCAYALPVEQGSLPDASSIPAVSSPHFVMVSLQDLLNSVTEAHHSEGFGQPRHAALRKEGRRLGARGIPGEKNDPPAQLRRLLLQCPVETRSIQLRHAQVT